LLTSSSNTSNISTVSQSGEIGEELDYSFTGTAISFHVVQDAVNWVIDIGPIDHITSFPDYLIKSKSNVDNFCIRLLNRTQMLITLGDVQLCNDLILKDTLVVLAFKYNLLSMCKLCKDNNCVAIFYDEICLIQDCAM